MLKKKFSGMSSFAIQEGQAQPFVHVLDQKLGYELASKIWKKLFAKRDAVAFQVPIQFDCRVAIQPECSVGHLLKMLLSAVGKTFSDIVLNDVKFESLNALPGVLCLYV